MMKIRDIVITVVSKKRSDREILNIGAGEWPE